MKLDKCNLCPRGCAADRSCVLGYCGAGTQAVVAKTLLHQWEEPCISYKNGSGTVFFSGCNKYADPVLAEQYSHAADYPEVAAAAIMECLQQKPKPVIKDGKMLSGVIIRHLLLPLATRNAITVTDWVAAHARKAYFSFMSQYTPCGPSLPKPLQRRVTRREYEKVTDHILAVGLENVYLQDFESANSCFIPGFLQQTQGEE